MIDIEEISDARFMSLLSVANSPQAKEFEAHVDIAPILKLKLALLISPF